MQFRSEGVYNSIVEKSDSRKIYLWQPLLLILVVFSLVGSVAIFDLNMIKPYVKVNKYPINPNYLFSKVDLPYKQNFLPSNYSFPFKVTNNVKELESDGLLVNPNVNLEGVTLTLSITDANDTKGTGNLLIEFDKKYQEVKIPLSGFQTKDKYLDVDFIKDEVVNNTLPSYFATHNNLLLDHVFLNDNSPSIDMKLVSPSVLSFDDNTGILYPVYSYNDKSLTVMVKNEATTEVVLNNIMDNIKINEIQEHNYNQLMTSYNTIESAFNLNAVKYIFDKPKLMMEQTFNDIKTQVTYKLIYDKAIVSKTINCVSNFIETQQKLFKKVKYFTPCQDINDNVQTDKYSLSCNFENNLKESVDKELETVIHTVSHPINQIPTIIRGYRWIALDY